MSVVRPLMMIAMLVSILSESAAAALIAKYQPYAYMLESVNNFPKPKSFAL